MPVAYILLCKIKKGEIKMKDYHPEGMLLNTEENKKYIQSASSLATAQMLEIILEAVVIMCDSEHNLIVDLGIMKGNRNRLKIYQNERY